MYQKYVRTNIAEMRPYTKGEILSDKVSVSKADQLNGSPKVGDMVARNPQNHKDKWLVAEKYFRENFREYQEETITINLEAVITPPKERNW